MLLLRWYWVFSRKMHQTEVAVVMIIIKGAIDGPQEDATDVCVSACG